MQSYMTKTQKNRFQIGDFVKIKKGTSDPDFGIDIGGWQGQIEKIEDGYLCIVWDSTTLSNFPDKYISQCEKEGLDWERIYLGTEEVELVVPCNRGNDLIQKRQEIQAKHRWDYLEDSGKRISKVLEHINPDDDLAAFEAWERYLIESLSFPFEAEISYYQTKGVLQQGDKIRIHSIWGYDDLYGVIVKLRYGRKVYHFPLCDIKVLDEKSTNSQIILDYRNWFANR